MSEITKQSSNEAENGNKSKPLLSSRLFKFRFYDTELKKIIYRNPLTYDFCVKTIIPMQFTGLFDKNNKEIYEDDIIIYNKIKGMSRIRFEKGSFFFYGKSTTQFLWNIEKKEIEVVGNLYENPELL